MTISFQDVDPYPKWSNKNGVFVGKRMVSLDPSDVAGFLNAIDTIPNNLWPFTNVGPGNAVLTDCEGEGFGGTVLDGSLSGSDPNAMMSYQKIHLLLTYTNDKVKVVGNRLLWETVTTGVKPFYMERPEEFHLTWSDGVTVVGNPMNAYMGTQNYNITQYRMISVPPSFWLFPGCCNSTNFYLRTIASPSFMPNTLLYLGGELVPQSSIGLASRQTIYHHFVHHPVDWNKFFRPETGEFEYVYMPSGQPYKPHTPVDLNLLIP